MKNPRFSSLLLACLLAAVLAVLFGLRKVPVAKLAPSPPPAPASLAQDPLPGEIPMPEALPEAEAATRPFEPGPLAPEAQAPKDWVKRTISEVWTDGPLKLAGRMRVRIVEADFKYPRLRLEEAVTTDPATGLETVSLVNASVADHLMVGLKPGTDPQLAAAALREKGYAVRAIEPDSYMLAEIPVSGNAGDQAKAMADLAALEEFIDHAEPDYLVFPTLAPNDPDYSQGKLWGLHNPGTGADSTADADIDAPEGWAIRKDAPGVVVAVTDTGIKYNHEDLAENMWTHPTNGSHGFDAYENDNDPMDTGGHGTHCAGTIGARGGNSKGLTGVAWSVKLMAVRFLGPNGGTTSDAIRSVNYSRLNGADIISASWGGGGYSQGLYDAIKACADAGIPFVAAAGNSSQNNDACPHYPSSYKLENIVAVASTTKKDVLSAFSCYGRTSVDIAAPGSGIWSSYIGANNSYTFLNGTSMATPHVSGALALAMAHFPTEDMERIIARLYGSVDKIPALAGKVASGGRLNLAKLLGGSPPNVFNDNFADAHRFEGDYGTWVGSNVGATREPDEDTFSRPGTGNKSMWLAFRTPHAGLVSIDVTGEILGFEAVVFEGGAKGQLVQAAYSDRLGGFYRAIRFNAKADTEYRIVVDTYAATRHRFRVDYSLSPPNDFLGDATPLSGDFFAASGSNRGATGELFELRRPHAGTGQGKSVWWKWTAPRDGDFIINTSGSAFDTVLAVYTGANGLTEVASNEDRSPVDWTSQVTIPAVAGTTYHIAVDSFREDSAGEIRLNGFRSGMLNIIRQPASISVELGRRAVFDVSVLSGGDVSYQWFFNDKAIPGQTSANLVIDPVRADDFGSYKVEVWNTENLATSNTAVLSEMQAAPRLTWSSGNQAVASGTAVTLAATFSGSTPITYAWTKNGQPIAGGAPSLAFPSAQVADAGAYRLTATNTAGSANADFTLSVVASPWDRWEWRRPGIPNAAITDIKVYGTEAFAVSATTLLRSTDGVNWTKSVFPQGFTANSFAKAGNMLLCNGLDTAGQFRVAISTNNGASWTVSATTGHPTLSPATYSIIGFGGGFITCDPNGSNYFRSTDGIAWTRLSTTFPGGSTANLTGNGRIASDGTTLILASTTSSSNGQLRFHKSTDGINWAQHETQATGVSTSSSTPQAAGYGRGRFHLFSTHSVYTSADGVNWDYAQVLNNGYSKTSMFASTPDTLVAFLQNSQTIRYFSTPSDPKVRVILPSNSHPFTAAATFGDRILFGTDKGLLSLVGHPLDVVIPRDRSTALASLEFTENLFIARTTNSGNTALQDLVSGDGVTWKLSTLLDNPHVTQSGSSFGKYYGNRTYVTAIHSGHNPFDMRTNAADGIGLAPNITHISQLPNGNALAVSAPSTGSASLHARTAGATAWTTVTFPQTVNTSLRFASLGDRWYSFPEGSVFSPASFQTSANGTTWTPSGLTGSNAQFVNMGGKYWCVYQGGTGTYPLTVASSTNGTSWTNLAAPTGLAAPSYQKFAKRVVALGDYLVMLGTDENLYYSQDGVTWLRGSVPGKVVDIVAANGQVVAVMKNGGLIQTGSPHPGGGAPLVSITSPQTVGTHLIGSRVTVEGAVSDPEDGVASYDCYMDSQLVASGTGNSFRFHVTTTDPNGHTVTIRARDSHGLRQIDAIRLKVAAAEPENLLANIQAGAVPGNHAVTFDGVFYSASSRSVYRSLDGKAWEQVPIPSFANPIYAMAAGNGSLVIQFDNGGIMTTRDGVNWTHFQPNLTSYWVREPLRFSSGVFIAAYQTQGTTSGSVMTSADGLIWETGTVSQEGYLSWTANSPDGTIIGAASSFNASVYRTRDGGFNWTPLARVSGLSPYNHHGMCADGRFLVAVTGSPGKLFSSPDTESWDEQPLPGAITNTPVLGHVGGLYLIGRSPDFSHVSVDAVTWQAMSHSVNHRKIAHARGLFVAEASTGGIITSRDGLTWTPVAGLPSTVSRILANEESYLLIAANGAAWTSRDGTAWENTLPGGLITTIDNRIGLSMAELNGRIVTAGSRMLVTSADNGRTWTNTTVNGLPPSTSNTFHKVVSSGSELLAFEGSFSSANTLHRSTDGVAFTTVPGLPAKTWADFAWNSSEWMLIATDGSLFRSTNGGLNWTQLAVTGMARGAAVAWHGGRWVIIGAETANSSSPYTGFTLDTGDVLLKHAVIGFYNSIYPVRTLIAHGKLVIWTRGESAFVTSNGTSWAAANLNAGAGNHDFDIYRTPGGFTAFVGSTVAYYPVQAWSAGTTGLTWSSIPSPFNSIQYADNLGDRVFLFTSGNISELHDKDLALTLPALSPVTLGVGDEVSANVTIRNFGRAIPQGGAWRLRAWLAKNRFFGDTKNIPIGTVEITAPMPAPGTSQSYPVSFTLPNEILTGDNFLILSLSGPSDVMETNTANNTDISDTAAINIPEWEFSVATNGNGQVNRDFAAARYPHKSQVSLTASAGKGASFTGWAGDAFSPNDQITILMDGDKSVQANFSNRATLQVFVKGMGEVSGLPDFGSYPVGNTAQVTAVPAPGWEFSHWSGASSAQTPAASIPMNVSKTAVANFVLPMAGWKNSSFEPEQLANSTISGDNMDPDKDGVPNWKEYLHGSHPMDGNSSGANAITIGDGFLRCVYTRNVGAADGGALTCQAGRGLTNWDSPDLQERILSTADGIETVEARIPFAGHGMGFIRFRYDPPQP